MKTFDGTYEILTVETLTPDGWVEAWWRGAGSPEFWEIENSHYDPETRTLYLPHPNPDDWSYEEERYRVEKAEDDTHLLYYLEEVTVEPDDYYCRVVARKT